MSNLIIQIDSLSFTYAGTSQSALKNITLKIARGDFLIITGPSGCGKSTLCRCLNGLIPHFYEGNLMGDVNILGMNTRDYTPKQLARYIGFVFQNPENQLFSLSVDRDIAFGPENLGLKRAETMKRVSKVISLLHLEGLRNRAPYELSGGQQQKVAIASILAMEPEIIVLDEPTSYLDPLSAVEIMKLLNTLKEELALSIILVEHRLDIASQFANKICVLSNGEIVDSGTPSEIYGKRDTYLLGVGVPRVSFLFQLLRERGYPIKDIPVTVEEACKQLEKMRRD